MPSKARPEESTNTVGFDPKQLNGAEQYKLLGGAVVPRPIALVTTQGSLGRNAAPFSYFMAIAQDPPMLIISIGTREEEGEFALGDGILGEKDTLRNLRETSEFVVHIVNNAMAQRMNVCALQYPPGVDEIERAGFRTAPSTIVRPPRLIDCPVQLECKVDRIIAVGRTPYHVVIGEVVYMHFARELVNDRLHVDWRRLDPIARLARPGVYLRSTDHFSMPTPKDRAPGEQRATAGGDTIAVADKERSK